MRWGGPFFLRPDILIILWNSPFWRRLSRSLDVFFFCCRSRATLYQQRPSRAVHYNIPYYYYTPYYIIMYTITLLLLPITDGARGLTVERSSRSDKPAPVFRIIAKGPPKKSHNNIITCTRTYIYTVAAVAFLLPVLHRARDTSNAKSFLCRLPTPPGHHLVL